MYASCFACITSFIDEKYKVDDDESGTIEYEEFFQLDYFIKRAQMMFTAADEGAILMAALPPPSQVVGHP
jgi:hypothetical protein